MMGIYTITNLVTGRKYVGSSVDLDKRRQVHFRELRKGSHHSEHLQASWAKHGEHAFVFEVVEYVEDTFWLIPREQAWIDRLCSADGRYGYNVCPTAGNRMGTIAAPETRQRQSDANRVRWASPEARQAHSESCKTWWVSPEARKHRSDAYTARCASPEARKKLADANKIRWDAPGAREKHSSTCKARGESLTSQLAEGSKSRWAAPGARERHAEAMKAAHAKKGPHRELSAEARKRMSDAAKVREAKKREAKNAI